MEFKKVLREYYTRVQLFDGGRDLIIVRHA